MNKRAFVTGGCGVNGSWVVRDLLARGFEVTAFDQAHDDSLMPDLKGHYEFAGGDVRDGALLSRLVHARKPEVLVHLAALVGYPQGRPDPKLVFDVNLGGTLNVLEAAVVNDVPRVVYTSSKSAYGVVTGEYARPVYKPVPEEHVGLPPPPSFLAMYGHAKIASEGLGANYQAAFGIDFFALRFATICAPGKLSRHGPMSIHSRLIENALLGVATTVEHGGDERDDIVYVRDVAQAIGLAAVTPLRGASVYNIGQGRAFGLQDMAAAIRQRCPGADITVGPGYDFMNVGFGAYQVLDISKAERELGYRPAFDLPAMVADYAQVLERFSIRPTATPSP
jgi:UDP-glucose 4-epimerase